MLVTKTTIAAGCFVTATPWLATALLPTNYGPLGEAVFAAAMFWFAVLVRRDARADVAAKDAELQAAAKALLELAVQAGVQTHAALEREASLAARLAAVVEKLDTLDAKLDNYLP